MIRRIRKMTRRKSPARKSKSSRRQATANVCDTSGKIMSREDAARWCAKMRRAGKTVVFTNGCFDILHAGHIAYLQKSRSIGDALIVGLNSDNSIRRLNKGPERPVQSQTDRAKILSALSCVDAISIFDEDTPFEIVKAVKPFIITKGKDWVDKSRVVGCDLVESWGGRVELIDLVEGRSTTAIVKKAGMKK